MTICDRKCADMRNNMSGPELDKTCVGKDGMDGVKGHSHIITTAQVHKVL